MKENAGKQTNTLSPILSRTATPKSINKANPPAETNIMGLKARPTSRPIAPSTSKIATSIPCFSKPKRLNSLFIFGDLK